MVIAAIALIAAATTTSASSHCADPPGVAQMTALAHEPARTVTGDDLLQVRTFGPQGPGQEDDAPFALSPDLRHVALLLRRADAHSNSYCQSLVVLDLANGIYRVVDRGGQLIRDVAAHGGIRAGFPSGFPSIITPSWSPDGQSLVYLKSDLGPSQVWRVRADGAGATPLTHEAQDVTAVAWSHDARTILFRTDRPLSGALAAIDVEGRSGWHYDERAFPINRAKPFPHPSDPSTLDHALDLATNAVRSATQAETDTLTAAGSASSGRATSPGGEVATLRARPIVPGGFTAKRALSLDVGGRTYLCSAGPCSSTRATWLSSDARSVMLLVRSGWGNGDQTFYRWTPRSSRMERLATTHDMLIGCRPVGKRMLCAREASTAPRRLVFLDPITGTSETVFNPNPDYDRLAVGKVERLAVTSADGSRTFADLMLPPNFVAGRRYPMVVVQYESRGFLSGGTNNEFPIPALASAGMIVLSFQRPPDVLERADPPPRTFSDAMRLDVDHWADRRNVHSALTAAIAQVVERGIVDTGRIGITGLSDGLATAAFALLNSDIFSVAALAGCCEEPIESVVLQGPQYGGELMKAGYPSLIKPDPAFWSDYSIAHNASRVHAPILIQAADSEYIASLPTFESLREAGVPVDLFVFPDEHHAKWQPAHKRAVWDRTLRWFEFWFDLPPVASQRPAPADEIVRWRDWRANWHPPVRSAMRSNPSLGVGERQQP